MTYLRERQINGKNCTALGLRHHAHYEPLYRQEHPGTSV